MSNKTANKFKETEIGPIPQDWEVVNFGNLLTLEYGKALKEDSRIDGDIPVFGSNGITGYHSQKLVNGPGIIVGRKGSAGEIIFSEGDFFPIDTTFYVKTDYDIKFIYYLLKGSNIKQLVGSSAVPGLNRNDLYSKKVAIPSDPNKQRQIAEILSSLDNKIEINHKINANLERLVNSLFKKWFVEVGDLPKNWRIGQVSDLIRVESGFPFNSSMFDKDGDYKLVTIKNVQDGFFVTECTDSLSEIPSKMPSHCELKNGDILLSLTGNVGRVCLIHGENYLLNQRVANLIPINENNRAFTYFLFRQKDFQNTLVSISRGTAQQNLSPIETKSLEIVIPPQEILDRFADVANPIFQKLIENNKEIGALSIARDTLLPRLISGKIQV